MTPMLHSCKLEKLLNIQMYSCIMNDNLVSQRFVIIKMYIFHHANSLVLTVDYISEGNHSSKSLLR